MPDTGADEAEAPEAGLPLTRFARTLLPELEFDRVKAHGTQELLDLVFAIWSDVELSALLLESETLFWERVLHFGRRGYLTPREEEEMRKLLVKYGEQLRAHLLASEREG